MYEPRTTTLLVVGTLTFIPGYAISYLLESQRSTSSSFLFFFNYHFTNLTDRDRPILSQLIRLQLSALRFTSSYAIEISQN